MADRNMWALGAELVENPSLWTRIKHSKDGSFFRRAKSKKGSTAFSVVKKAGVLSLKLVPVPVVKDLLSAAFDKAADASKQYYRDKKLGDRSALNRIDKVKFGWKELDVQDMDRYRWKVADSVKSLNDAAQKFNQSVPAIEEKQDICDEWIKVTKAHAYAVRRSQKLRSRAETIKALCEQTIAWLDESDNKIRDWKTSSARDAQQLFENNHEDHHENCSETVCMLADAKKWRLKNPNIMNNSVAVISTIRYSLEPIDIIVETSAESASD